MKTQEVRVIRTVKSPDETFAFSATVLASHTSQSWYDMMIFAVVGAAPNTTVGTVYVDYTYEFSPSTGLLPVVDR